MRKLRNGGGMCLPDQTVETLHATSLRPNPQNQDVPHNDASGIRRGKKCFALTLIFICCLFNNAALAQSHQEGGADAEVVTPLVVGQRVPEEFWTKEHLFYVNGDTVRGTLEEYRGKPLILDFWATWCGGCIANFHKLERIQTLFGQDINVFLINSSYTKDTYEKIHHSHHVNVPAQWKGRIPTVILDDYLIGLFPHRGVPFYVWIGKSGVVSGYTRAHLVGVNEVNNYLEL